MKRESTRDDVDDVAKARRVGGDSVVVLPVREPRVWSIADDGKETTVAALDPNGLVQHLNKTLYHERKWGKKRDIFAEDDAAQMPQHEPGVLAVAAQLAYARFEMEALAAFATLLAQGKRLQPDHVLDPPRPLEDDELQRRAGRVWARKLAFRSASAKLRDAAARVRDVARQGTLFFADVARLRPAWSMRLRRRGGVGDALELMVRVDACMTPESYQWVPLQWSAGGVVLELAPLFQLMCNGALAGGALAAVQTHRARGAANVHRLLMTLRASLHASCVFRMLSDAANKAVGVAQLALPFAASIRVEPTLLAADLALHNGVVSTVSFALVKNDDDGGVALSCATSWLELQASHALATMHRRVLACREPVGREDVWVAALRLSALQWALRWHAHGDFCSQVKRALCQLAARVPHLWFSWSGTDAPNYGTTGTDVTLITNVHVFHGELGATPFCVVSLVDHALLHINGVHKSWTVSELCATIVNTLRVTVARTLWQAVCRRAHGEQALLREAEASVVLSEATLAVANDLQCVASGGREPDVVLPAMPLARVVHELLKRAGRE